jgi:integrase
MPGRSPILTWLLLSGLLGMRTGEIAAMTREDVVEIAGRLVICGRGKGGKPFKLPVPAGLVDYLTPHLRGPGPLWLTAQGKQITSDRLGTTVSRYLRRLSLPWTLHNLRHRFCTQLYGQTLDLALVQDLARHGSPAPPGCT